MKNAIERRLILPLVAVSAMALAALTASGVQAQQPLRVAYVTWSSSTASSNLVKAVLQSRLGYPVELVAMSADDMWRAVAEGAADVMLSAWLPGTHGHYLDQYGGRMVDLGPNMEGVRTGLVVPAISTQRQTTVTGLETEPYIKADSIPELNGYADQFGRKIIGIDPAAGIMRQTREAIEAYDLNLELIAGSEDAMTDQLAEGIANRRWIVVTGWTPHWKFARWRLKFLKDPKGIYGQGESIHTMVRAGLKEDVPAEVYSFLDNFSWTPDQLGQLLIWNQMEGAFPFDTAQRWMETHQAQVDGWLQ